MSKTRDIEYHIKLDVGLLSNMTSMINGEDRLSQVEPGSDDKDNPIDLLSDVVNAVSNTEPIDNCVTVTVSDKTFNTLSSRGIFIVDLKEKLHAMNIEPSITCNLTITPYETCMKRLNMSETEFMEYATSFELPYFYEGFDEIEIIWDLEDWNESIRYYINYEASTLILKAGDGKTKPYSLKDMITDIPMIVEMKRDRGETGFPTELSVLNALRFFMISKVKQPTWKKGGNLIDAYYALLYLSSNEVDPITRIRPRERWVLESAIILQWIDSVSYWKKNEIVTAHSARKLLGTRLYVNITRSYDIIYGFLNKKEITTIAIN